MTHKAELLAWFRRGLSITPVEAVVMWNNYRLADTVYQLRRDGHCINTQTMERINDEGRRVTWARYSYVSGPKGNGEMEQAVQPSEDSAPAKPKSDVLHRLRSYFRYRD